MNESDQTEKIIFDQLKGFAKRGKGLLKKGNIKPTHVQFWAIPVRTCLSKLYGKESEISQCFMKLSKKIPPESAPEELYDLIKRLLSFLDGIYEVGLTSFCKGSKSRIFVGHGRSPQWRELKDFLADRLGLDWDEFNREAVAGFTTFERISEMLENATFAFLIMTAEDEHFDDSIHARQNVVHEVGLFQGRLGPRKAIILLEEGCEEFSNIIGLSQIRFPKGNISASFEEIRRVLERESII